MKNEWITFQVTPERRTAIREEISSGSTPAARFYVMTVISALLATMGLIANSPAVIIGAMLVAPLMTPIFGMSLALLRGEPLLLGRAIQAELRGVILVIALAFLFGLLPLAIKPTPEMLARTQPNLLDLFVAVFSGFAGAYAIADERISPSLPGVAIATAIVPPLANVGLCLALGEYFAALGSLLLFLANFLSILLAGASIFAIVGMASRFHTVSSKHLPRRFGLAILSFSLVAFLFTYSLISLVSKRRLRAAIEHTLVEELAEIPGTYLRETVFQYESDEIDVLATVRTPTMVSPQRVSKMENLLRERTQRNIKLIVRNDFVKDIAAAGATLQVAAQNLEGEFLRESVSEDERVISTAEQVLWEECSMRPGFQIVGMELHDYVDGELLLATIQCLYPMQPELIQTAEEEIRNRTGRDDVYLVVSSHIPMMQIRRGNILFEWSRYEGVSPKQEQILDRVKARAEKFFESRNDMFLLETHFRVQAGSTEVLFEVSGTRMMTPEELAELGSDINEETVEHVEVSVWHKNEAVLSEKGLMSYRDFVRWTERDLVESLEKNIEWRGNE